MDIKTDTNQKVASPESISQIADTNAVPAPNTASTPTVNTNTQAEGPVDPMDIKPENSVLNKTVSDGIDMENIKSEIANANSIQENNPSFSQIDGQLNNEIVKPKMNYSLIAIVAGIFILAGTALAYYFLIYKDQATNTAQETNSEVNSVVKEAENEKPQEANQNVNTDIKEDDVISDLNSLGNSDNTSQLENELNSIDFEGIDTSLQLTDF